MNPRCTAFAVLGALLLALPFGAPAAGGEAGRPLCDVRDPVPPALREAGVTRFTEEPGAGRWRTWLVPLGEVAVPPPPSTTSPQHLVELAEVKLAAMSRDAGAVQRARFWGEGAAGGRWTEELLALIARHSHEPGTSPPRYSRQIAMFETAVFDALVAAWNAKYCYLRPPPSHLDPTIEPVVEPPPAPSYPSEHAVVAGVADVLLPAFFPAEADRLHELAWEAALSRVAAGTNYRSDVGAGMALGRAVARAVLRARAGDGSEAVWDGTGRVTGTCNWEPTPPAFRYPPAEPLWGKVRPWLMRSGDQLRPGPPPACDGPEYLAAAEDLYRTSQGLTARQEAIAEFWAGGPGTPTPPGINLRIALEAADRHALNTMRHARVLAYVGAAEADAAIAAWDAKFTYWWDRPVLTIRRLWDPAWTPLLTTPPFPGYISGHATFSGAASEVLGRFFPEEATAFRAMATEAALSRFYGGIHVRYDNDVGLEVGGRVAALALERAGTDGAD